MSELFISLQKEIEYAKKAFFFPERELYKVYGRITMARELAAITKEEYLDLNHSCVADGINNPKYFDKD
jgi:hypothetical protein